MFYDSLEKIPRGAYKTIYADPPWMEQGGGNCKRGADRHYALMHTLDICALPVKDIPERNAHLYLWVTNNFLRDGFQVIEAWGFRYVTIITWAKPTFGLGQYFRGQTEHCLFAVRGALPYKTSTDGKRQQGSTLLSAGKGRHSEKPMEMYEMIEKVSYGPRLELFSRNERAGWDYWGSEEAPQGALNLAPISGPPAEK